MWHFPWLSTISSMAQRLSRPGIPSGAIVLAERLLSAKSPGEVSRSPMGTYGCNPQGWLSID